MQTMEKDFSLQAAQIARDKTLKTLKRYRITPGRVAKRLSEALDAKEVKATYDKEFREWVYSEPLIAHAPRLKAVELASVLLDMKPADKHEIDLKQPIVVEVVKFAKSADPQ